MMPNQQSTVLLLLPSLLAPGSRWRFQRAEFFGSGLASPETRRFYARK
jgi:hypothetical protein